MPCVLAEGTNTWDHEACWSFLLAHRDNTTNPHSLSFQLDSNKRQRGLMSANSGSFDFDEEPKSQTGSGTAGRQRAASPDEEDEDEDEDEDSDEEDSDDSEPSRALEGAYDPADYANLPVNTKIKELFQYITRWVGQTLGPPPSLLSSPLTVGRVCRYTPQSIELEHSLKPFIPEYIPAVGDIDAFLKVGFVPHSSF